MTTTCPTPENYLSIYYFNPDYPDYLDMAQADESEQIENRAPVVALLSTLFKLGHAHTPEDHGYSSFTGGNLFNFSSSLRRVYITTPIRDTEADCDEYASIMLYGGTTTMLLFCHYLGKK